MTAPISNEPTTTRLHHYAGRYWLAACRRRVAALMVQFPPFGGGEAASQAGVVPTVQTTSVNNVDNGVLWAKWSAFWAQRCLSWRVVSM